MGGTAPQRPRRAGPIRMGLAALLAAITLVSMAPPVGAHAFLLFTNPGFDGAVPESPESVDLVFNEPVTATETAITITDSTGKDVETAPIEIRQGGTTASAAVSQQLGPGVYRVRWEAVGVDGHGADGEFRFAVGTVITDSAPGNAIQDADWPAAGIKWLLWAGFAMALGGLVGERITSRIGRQQEGLPPLRSWAFGGALLGLMATAAAAVKLAVGADSLSVLWGSTAGRGVLLEAVGFALALILVAVKRPFGAMLALAFVALVEGAGSHSEIEYPGVGALLTATHLAAVGVWAGALLHIGRAAARWRAAGDAVRQALWGYARIAAWLFAVVVVTRISMALLLVPLPALTGTSYGRSLLIKLALVLLVIASALVGRWALRAQRLDRVTRATRVEAVTLVVVLAATSVLVATPTPGTFTALPPPLPAGAAVPAGGLAGQIGVNVVASEGQVVVRLSTPSVSNEFEPAAEPEYALSGELQTAAGSQVPIEFRSCGLSCFVAPAAWANGENVISLRADAPGWRGGGFAALIPWPAAPADDLVERTARVMRGLGRFTVYEAVTSDGEAAPPNPGTGNFTSREFIEGEPYKSGVAPIAAEVTTESGVTKLLMGFPAAGIYAEVTLDGLGRITEETIAAPNHLMKRRFDYSKGK